MGWSSVEAGLRQISSRELSEWLVFNEVEPIGDRRGDLQAGIIAAAVANALAGRKRGKAFTAMDFMPEYWPSVPGKRGKLVEVDSLSVEQQVSWIEMMNMAYGGKDLRQK